MYVRVACNSRNRQLSFPQEHKQFSFIMELAVFCEILTDLFNTLKGKTDSYIKYIECENKSVFLMTGADLREAFKIFKDQDI